MYTADEQAKHRKQWVDALRSGKYEQGKYRLRKDAQFCCLGVACDISGLGAWVVDTDKIPDAKGQETLYSYRISTFAEASQLSAEMASWLGVRHTDVKLHSQKNVPSLVYANDTGLSFNEIADIIERDEIVTQ